MKTKELKSVLSGIIKEREPIQEQDNDFLLDRFKGMNVQASLYPTKYQNYLMAEVGSGVFRLDKNLSVHGRDAFMAFPANEITEVVAYSRNIVRVIFGNLKLILDLSKA